MKQSSFLCATSGVLTSQGLIQLTGNAPNPSYGCCGDGAWKELRFLSLAQSRTCKASFSAACTKQTIVLFISSSKYKITLQLLTVSYDR